MPDFFYWTGDDASIVACLRELQERRASVKQVAPILADMFSGTVLPALDAKTPRSYLYVWERKALAWLNAWRAAGGDEPICAWTSHYMENGPPPWPRDRKAPALEASAEAKP